MKLQMRWRRQSNMHPIFRPNKWIREIEIYEKELISAQCDQSMATIDIQIKMNLLLFKIEQEISEFGMLDVNFIQPSKLIFWKEKHSQQLLIPLNKRKSVHLSYRRGKQDA